MYSFKGLTGFRSLSGFKCLFVSISEIKEQRIMTVLVIYDLFASCFFRIFVRQ